MSTTTPMLRSQTSAVLVPTWITDNANNAPSSSAFNNAGTSSSSSSASPSGALPPAAATGGSYVAPSRTTRNSALSSGLASWRSSHGGVSPGTSPSLGASQPPPPPPSYSATVGPSSTSTSASASSTTGATSSSSAAATSSATSKKATIFCEISDAVYNRLNEAQQRDRQQQQNQQVNNNNNKKPSNQKQQGQQESSASQEESAAAAGEQLQQLASSSQAKQDPDAGKYLTLLRIAGLPDEEASKDKVASAVTIACQTQLSEPPGRFFVFELPPAMYELWPAQAKEQLEKEQKSSSKENNKSSSSSSSSSSRAKKSGGKNQQQNEPDGDDMNPPELDLPSSADKMHTSRLVCVICPSMILAQSIQNKLESVFCGEKQQEDNNNNNNNNKKVLMDVVQRPLPTSCCLVVKASNSSNKHQEAECVPWMELMNAGAVSPSSLLVDSSTSSSPATTPTTAAPTSSASQGPQLPSYDETFGPEASSSSSSSNNSGIPCPFVPSYFRLLRNERGSFRNALFLRFPSQAKAEVSMMYLERLVLCGRRIRVEHKKQSRSAVTHQLQQTKEQQQYQTLSPQQDSTAVTASSSATSSAGVSPQQSGTISPSEASSSSSSHPATNIEMMEANVNELLKRFDRDGFSYPKRLLSKDDLKYLADLTAAHELTLDVSASSNQLVTVMINRKSRRGSNSVSPALTAQTPKWAPQTPPLAPHSLPAAAATSSSSSSGSGSGSGSDAKPPLGNDSFSAKASAGTMTFRGLRHWKEARADLNNSTSTPQQNSNNNNKTGDDSMMPPPMALDGGSATQKYLRGLGPEEAAQKGIVPFSSGRGRPIHEPPPRE